MAYVTARVTQRRLGEVALALAAIPEVLEATGINGPADLMIRVAAADADDLYRIAGQFWPSTASSAPTPRSSCAT